ncbi:uncharacterized protein LOC129773105 [Toxorhynchites rutilus septentrionalis]|uniref:uncharacterized protein LOC129773105 n=1 Tax=Toxorhynchites rutilus septentrionalis TaxID=329112 RepID=UPI002478EACF|nr:uncharacterized protein LOC129773105 [Toxorhynchites rutilus septentrionalis]
MIADYEVKGYAHKATSKELTLTKQNRVWYLPLVVVSNPKKPHKIRLIWDAAAKTDGVCFNSLLLKGPDLLTPLPQVLSQFRQFPVAVCGDIREMFHQIKIQSQRFLWRSTPTVYVMDVATFGSTCSPASAQYVKNLNASEAAGQFPRAAAAITLNHYVDDYLASFLSTKEAIAVVNEVKQVHAMGGFEMRNFLPNKSEVLRGVGELENGVEKELDLIRGESSQSVLGMIWFPKTDEFAYTFTMRKDLLPILAKDHVPTKREVLKVVMMFWSDSSTVLAWIRSDHRRYNKFVSFQIGEILSFSEPNEWKWVPSKLNAADAATKWENGSEIKSDGRWFLGPNFLRLTEEQWPKEKSVSTTEEELRSVHTHWEKESTSLDSVSGQDYFVRWDMYYALSTIFYIKKCNSPSESGVLTREEIKGAEEALWKIAQSDDFFEEMKSLKETQGSPHDVHCIVAKSSSIYRAWPFIDDRGVLRMRGRISATQFASYEAKYPAILPRQHRITFLITDWYHRRFRHGNKESIVNEMHQRFEISKLRTLVKKMLE